MHRKSISEAGNHMEIWNLFENIYIFSNVFCAFYFRSTLRKSISEAGNHKEIWNLFEYIYTFSIVFCVFLIPIRLSDFPLQITLSDFYLKHFAKSSACHFGARLWFQILLSHFQAVNVGPWLDSQQLYHIPSYWR